MSNGKVMESQHKKPIKLTDDELAALDKGILAAENGRRWTVEEAFNFVREQRKTWLKQVKKNLSA
jgi:hypothetical protein